MKRNILDKAVSFINPNVGLRRMEAKAKLEKMERSMGIGRHYDAARPSRYNKDWYDPLQSANQEVNEALHILRNRSRNLVGNDDYSSNIPRVISNNVVGTGIMPNISSTNDSLNKKIKKYWSDWAAKLICDVDGRCTFYTMQRLAMRTVVVSGEALVIRKWQKGGTVPFKLQIIEGDLIDTTRYELQTPSGGAILYGIEFNSDGSRKGYYIYNKHPSEFSAKSFFIKAEDVIHLYEIERPGQYRGLPFSKSSMLTAKDVSDYRLAEKVRAKMAASFAAFITGSDNDPDAVIPADDLENIEPGSMVRLGPGEDVRFSTPPMSQGFNDFVKDGLRGMSVGSGVPYANATGDYSDANFSSARMGYLEFSRNVQTWQWDIIIPHLCDRVFDWFVQGLKLSGALSMNKDVSVIWTAPRREMVDPLKETNARAQAVKNGFVSRQEVMREDGYNPDDMNEEIQKDVEWQRKNGLNFAAVQEIFMTDDLDKENAEVDSKTGKKK